MLVIFLQFAISVYNFIITDNTLINITGDGTTVTIPARVIDFSPDIFSRIPATRLSFEEGSLISSLSSRIFNGSKFQEIIFPEHYIIANSNLFRYVPTITSLTYLGPVHTIQAYAYNGCNDLTQVSIQDRRILYRGVLTFSRTSVRYVEANAFQGLYVVQIILPQEIFNPWDFTFSQFPFLIILRVDAPLYYLTTGMFADLESLETITHNGENLLSHLELD